METGNTDQAQSAQFEAQNSDSYEVSRRAVETALSQEVIRKEELRILQKELHARRSEDLRILSPEQQAEKIEQSVGQVSHSSELLERLQLARAEGRKLKIKYGIDPTGSDVHLGHAVPMLVLDRFQRMGHDITFIIGDFTAKIGDPSGRVASRPVLTDEAINSNMETYNDQVLPLFDMDNIEVVKNNDWLDNYPHGKLMSILSRIPVSMLLQRKDFRERIANGIGVSYAETMYPIYMALDSVHLDTDIEIGGRDQFLNMMICRRVMEICGKVPEVVITTDILEGTDGSGAKMSKSLGNYVGLSDSSEEIFGRVMSIPDSLLGQYYKMLTEIEPSEWEKIEVSMAENKLNPMEIKKLLAKDVVAALKNPSVADETEAAFTSKFSEKNYEEMEETLPTVANGGDLVAQIASIRGTSNSALRELIKGGGLKVIDQDGNSVKVQSIHELYEPLRPNARFIKAGRQILRVIGNERDDER